MRKEEQRSTFTLNAVKTLVCAGNFSAVTVRNGRVVVASGKPLVQLYSLELSGNLRRIQKRRGWIRSLAFADDGHVIAVDCRLLGIKDGLGIIWRIKLLNGKRKPLGHVHPLSAVRALRDFWRSPENLTHRERLLAAGLLSWPTDVCFHDGNCYVAEARRLLRFDPRERIFDPRTDRLFFNLVAVCGWRSNNLLLLEHVLGR